MVTVAHRSSAVAAPGSKVTKARLVARLTDALSTAQVSVYAIQPGRGFEQAARVLGADFAGFLVRDGWSVYRQFLQALHQTCLAHLLRGCREMILVAGKCEAVFPRNHTSHLARSFATARSSRERPD